jgi:hypothetical protein
VRFESSFILVHFAPLFFLSPFLKTKNNRSLIRKIATLFIAVGFVSSFFAKAFSGWLSPDSLAIKSYFLEFYNSFNVPIIFGNQIIKISNDYVWKLFDYAALIFELSLLLLFFTNSIRLKKILFSLAVVFHICVYAFFGIGQFFLYPVLYLFCFKFQLHEKSNKRLEYFKGAILVALIFLFIQNNFLVQFFQNSLSLGQYLYFELGLLMITSGIWFSSLVQGFNFRGNEN